MNIDEVQRRVWEQSRAHKQNRESGTPLFPTHRYDGRNGYRESHARRSDDRWRRRSLGVGERGYQPIGLTSPDREAKIMATDRPAWTGP